MDTLFISNETQKSLLEYCSEELITEVLGHFAKKGEIVVNDTFEKPIRGFLTADYWVITDYIKDDTIEYRKKATVQNLCPIVLKNYCTFATSNNEKVMNHSFKIQTL